MGLNQTNVKIDNEGEWAIEYLTIGGRVAFWPICFPL